MRFTFLIRFSFITYSLLQTLSVFSQSRITVGQPISTAITDDRNPVISGDGKTLIFEQFTRTAEGPELLIAFMGATGGWSRPEPVPNTNLGIKGLLNGGYTLNFDGTRLYFHSARYGGLGGADIWYMDRTSTGNTWTTPQNLLIPINTTGHETYPTLSPYGDLLFYTVITNEKTSNGSPCGKIVMAKKKGRDGWEAGVELPAIINNGCSCNGKLLADGKTFVFSSERKDTKGGYDLYQTIWEGDQNWSVPKAIDVLNTPEDNVSFSLPAASNLVYIDGLDKTGKGYDIQRVALPPDLQPAPTVVWSGMVVYNQEETAGVQLLLKNTSKQTDYTFYASPKEIVSLPLTTNVSYILYAQSMKKGYCYQSSELFVRAMSEKIPLKDITLNLIQPGIPLSTTTIHNQEGKPSAAFPYEVKQLSFFLKYNAEVKLQLIDFYIPIVSDSTLSDSNTVVSVEPAPTVLYQLYQALRANGIDSQRLVYIRKESDTESYSIMLE